MGPCISKRKADTPSLHRSGHPNTDLNPRPSEMGKSRGEDVRLDDLQHETGQVARNHRHAHVDGPGIESLSAFGREKERLVERKRDSGLRMGVLGNLGGIWKPGPVVLGDKEGRRIGRGGGKGAGGGVLAPVVLGK